MTSKPYLSLSKSVCEVCGTLNVVDGEGAYSFGKDVYSLNACDYNFFLDFDNTTHTPYDNENHITTLKKGKYCQFCKGTYARAEDKQEPHEITEIVDAQLGNQRFHITGECEDCGFIENEYAVAKSIVQSYYGIADGAAHTITLSDLSESGVNTSIRYGESANKCNLTTAPNYTEAGYYPIYYEITYRYSDESMKENGVSYVWLLADNSSSKAQSDTATPHVHDYRFLETVRPTCTELGYDRFQCADCGALQKTNYVPASGHDYQTVEIRKASCQQGGLELHSCNKCGAFYTEETSMTDHKYQITNVVATCTTNGYTEHKCIDCGYKYITDLTPLAKHDYRTKATDPTCTERGFTTYTCADCGDTYVSDYTDAKGHEWDNGHEITHATCNGEGLIEYNCKHCDATKREAKSATGHTPGAAATCTEPQTCTVCGAILELPTGHHYSEAVTVPTCTTMGYTTYTCDECGKSYIGNYTDKTEHHYDSVITPATCTAMGYTTYTCTECGDEEHGFTAVEFKAVQADGWEKQYQYKVGNKKIYMTPSEAEAQNLERVSKNPKSTHYGRQSPICAKWNSEEQILIFRKAWEEAVNKSLEQKNIDARVNCHSFADRGIDEQPTIHEGVTARIMEKQGFVSDCCEVNRQIRRNNALLRQLKALVKSLTESAKDATAVIAEKLENFRKRAIFSQYELKHNEKISADIQHSNTVIDLLLSRFNNVKKQISQKNSKSKKVQTEKDSLSVVNVFRHRQLSEQLENLQTEVEELKTEKAVLLSDMNCVSEKDRNANNPPNRAAVSGAAHGSEKSTVDFDRTRRPAFGIAYSIGNSRFSIASRSIGCRKTK